MPISEMSDITGQQTMANSASVVVASDQTAVPISAASLPLPTGAATAANQATANTTLAAIDAGIPVALGQTTMTNSMPVTIASDQSAIPIYITSSTRSTYGASVSGLVSGLLATDFFTITGSATKTVRVTEIGFSGTSSGGTTQNIILLKRSTANSVGTSTTPTNVSYDSSDAAATATLKAYTVNPTLGTLVGNIRTVRTFLAGAASTAADIIIWPFGDRPSKTIVLRGTSEVLALNLGGATVSSSIFDVWIEWTEE